MEKEQKNNADLSKIIDSLSPNEKKILPFTEEKTLEALSRKSGLDKTGVLRALEFLSNKGIVELKQETEKTVELGLNGLIYIKNGLPERKLLHLVFEKGALTLKEAEQQSKLSENEFKAALGALKKKALINLKDGKIVLTASREDLSNKSLEEKFLETLPRKFNDLLAEEKYALESLRNRKDIINIKDKRRIIWSTTELRKKISKKDLENRDFIESNTPDIIKNDRWKGKKFRRYDILSPVPRISGGKRHFVNQATDYARKIWLEMGFKEMTGNLVTTGFWNFDSLFTPQDHPARELQDTFFIDGKKAKLPDKKIVEAVKRAHQGEIKGSRGWQYKWEEGDAKKVLLRAHTTCLSSQTLTNLKEKDLPAKFFAIGKCFRNETIDWSHGFEFNQTEGIVVDENANFRHLLGYLTEFAKKMGYEKVRFRPHYFPYTEPSLEGDVWNEERKEWMEVFSAGIFRPEVTEPLLGKPVPVLAWGPGFDRMIMLVYNLKDLRDLYKNDLDQLREIKFWPK